MTSKEFLEFLKSIFPPKHSIGRNALKGRLDEHTVFKTNGMTVEEAPTLTEGLMSYPDLLIYPVNSFESSQ